MEKQQLIEIGQRLRSRRQELGLTREKMSELANIGSGYYGQLEVGTSQMSIDTLIKLSQSMQHFFYFFILYRWAFHSMAIAYQTTFHSLKLRLRSCNLYGLRYYNK